jgi:hypothetical protein
MVRTKRRSHSKKIETRKILRSRVFFTHHNRGRPYMIRIRGNTAEIYTHKNDIPYDRQLLKGDYTVPVKKYTSIKKVFVGKSIPGDDMYASYPNNPKKAAREGKGNSLLITLGKLKYVFVGHKIIEFTTDEPIKEYYSMIGRNDVPYPVMISDKNVYFIVSKEKISYVSREKFEGFPKKHSWGLNAHDKLWGMNDFTKEESVNVFEKVLKNQKQIHSAL